MPESKTVKEFIRAIERLPEDELIDSPDVWYRSQQEHWLGWLDQYDGPGAYGRKGGQNRDAKFAYNHIVNYQMLLWLADAAGLPEETVEAAYEAARTHGPTLQARSGAIRKVVPWEMIAEALWGTKRRRRLIHNRVDLGIEE